MLSVGDSLKVLEDLGKLINYAKTRRSTQFKELLEPTFNDNSCGKTKHSG